MMPSVQPFGDRAILIDWPVESFDASVNAHALALSTHLRALDRFTEIVPGYSSLLVEFDPVRLSLEDAKYLIDRELPLAPQTIPDGPLHDIPVHYGGKHGPDMSKICESSGLSEADVIALHAESTYRVCMIGFIPGFAFLSEVPSVLAHPRHATPRANVPAGSVGIAGWQTGIYGLDSPGGWQIIGRTERSLFDMRRDAPFLVQAGDRIRFVPK
jgi:KipI family sensor histidine kinase inhibitor